ncbi:hypothetical protein AOQ84DRAFT_354247 [Glonium stellatum]|uniref:Xylanolytic transcriptional activator regulatory domain-containing protein n=1 Tax=Glonium stellatum TaxID=574774 RepID=A0A8E2F1V9_9PEZI|nr:hypothetical protein AOQ84DRAFT_354247 [Glonium stellatum]
MACKEIERLLSGSDAISKIETETPSPGSPDPDIGGDIPISFDAETGPVETSTAPCSLHTAQETTLKDPKDTATQPRSFGLPTIDLPAQQSSKWNWAQKLKLPTNIWRLFDVYFAYTHCWFPIAEKHDVLKISYSYPEDGLNISSSTPGSGDHAELWSILALASIQESSVCNDASFAESGYILMSSDFLYATARSLVPHEQGQFELGHVKALLLLALINLGQDHCQAAWLLVGYAIRISLSLEQAPSSVTAGSHTETQNSRYKHVYVACFILDTVISTKLDQAPHLRSPRFERYGPLKEDGLEEWHPWVGCHGFGINQDLSKPSARSPVHTLSTFNRLATVVSILNNASKDTDNPREPNSLEPATLLQKWKTALPLTCDFVQTGTLTTTPTPPLFLLRLVYLSIIVAFDISPIQTVIQIIDLLERYNDIFGFATVPPIVYCFLDIASKYQAINALDIANKTRLQNLKSTYCKVWGRREKRLLDEVPTSNTACLARSTVHGNDVPSSSVFTTRSTKSSNFQLHTPESLHTPFHPTFLPPKNAILEPTGSQSGPEIFDGLLQDMSPSAARRHGPISYPTEPRLSSLESAQSHTRYNGHTLERYGSASSLDLEAFFDELASLDGAERLDNQPQFMQNLGFAPDADLTDLLTSEYGPFDPLLSAYLHQADVAQSALGQNRSYDGG